MAALSVGESFECGEDRDPELRLPICTAQEWWPGKMALGTPSDTLEGWAAKPVRVCDFRACLTWMEAKLCAAPSFFLAGWGTVAVHSVLLVPVGRSWGC